MNKKQPLPAPEPIHLTPAAIDRLNARLANLRHTLPAAAAEAARTAAYGDRSENAEYKEAKSILRRTQRQIWTIEEQLKRVIPIVHDAHADTVQLGSTVTLHTESRTSLQYQILGPFEANPNDGVISHRSPLGAALMGKRINETITVKTPAGIRHFTILTIH